MTEQIIQPRKDEFQLSPASTALLAFYGSIARSDPKLAKLFDKCLAELDFIPTPSDDREEAQTVYAAIFQSGLELAVKTMQDEADDASGAQGVIELA